MSKFSLETLKFKVKMNLKTLKNLTEMVILTGFLILSYLTGLIYSGHCEREQPNGFFPLCLSYIQKIYLSMSATKKYFLILYD